MKNIAEPNYPAYNYASKRNENTAHHIQRADSWPSNPYKFEVR